MNPDPVFFCGLQTWPCLSQAAWDLSFWGEGEHGMDGQEAEVWSSHHHGEGVLGQVEEEQFGEDELDVEGRGHQLFLLDVHQQDGLLEGG